MFFKEQIGQRSSSPVAPHWVLHTFPPAGQADVPEVVGMLAAHNTEVSVRPRYTWLINRMLGLKMAMRHF